MIEAFEDYCRSELSRFYKTSAKEFEKSLTYSFFSGGKRIRPKLIMSLGADLGLPKRSLYPAAFAIELVHTYSLIHDDLPAMDDDDIRRGKPTHHKKFGEASAVLAGDGLLTFAFQILAENYRDQVLKTLVLSLSKSSGSFGMIGGQVLDCMTDVRSKEIFNRIHLLKTGMLFGFCLLAPPVILGKKKYDSYERLGHEIGLLFQLQDDLFDEDKKEERFEENILSVVSKKELTEMIDEKKESIEKITASFDHKTKNLESLIQIVFDRKM